MYICIYRTTTSPNALSPRSLRSASPSARRLSPTTRYVLVVDLLKGLCCGQLRAKPILNTIYLHFISFLHSFFPFTVIVLFMFLHFCVYLYKACKVRILKKPGDDCEQWYFDYLKCIDKCRVPKIFKQLK